jgi:hypothetical protein
MPTVWNHTETEVLITDVNQMRVWIPVAVFDEMVRQEGFKASENAPKPVDGPTVEPVDEPLPIGSGMDVIIGDHQYDPVQETKPIVERPMTDDGPPRRVSR